ncbi:MAG TPA: hypothetical protein VL137_08160 [Polyangiaceae bacterium]|nr:hypothetical protein [Polyangiaceae bacterium]
MNDALLDALWQKIEQNWDEEAAHDRFLRACVEERQLPFAAAHYRAAMRDQGRDSTRYLGRITALALTQIDASRTPQRTVRRNAQNLVAIILMLSLALALLLMALTGSKMHDFAVF